MDFVKNGRGEKYAGYIIAVIAAGLSLFQIYTSVFGSLLAYKQRLIHLTAELALAYLLFNRKGKQKEKRFSFSAFLILVVLLGSVIYIFANYSTIAYRIGNPSNIDLVIGLIYVI